MAAFVVTRTIANYLDRTKQGDKKRLKDAVNGGETESEKALNQILRQPDFIITGTTDTNTAAASSPVISLSDNGVTFPANTYRDILVEVHAGNGSNAFRWMTRQRVLGGTDPTLKGPERYVTDCTARYVCTTDGSTTSVEVAAECMQPEWFDGAAPVAGAFSSGAATVQWLGANLPSRTLTPLTCQNNLTAAATNENFIAMIQQTISLTNSTTVLAGVDVTGTEAAAIGAGRIEATVCITPPCHAPVLIDTVSTPDEVFIGALGLSSDLVTWVVKVYVGDLVALTLV